MDLLLALGPIVLLILLMTVRGGLPSHVALPLVALVMLLVKAVWFGNSPGLLQATVAQGLMKAVTPITIVWGAIILFRTMEAAGAMDLVRRWLDGLTGNPVGQLMVVGWAFVFLIEGASGFGTPAALAAPLLVGMGFPPLRAALFCLVMDTVPVTFGAVGTPIWFGLGEVAAAAGPAGGEAVLQAVSWRAGLINAAMALVVPPAALLLVVPAATVWRNLRFVLLSVLATVGPYAAVSAVSYEFPTLVGGLTGLLGTALLARRGIGLSARDDDEAIVPARDERAAAGATPGGARLVRALFPLWGTVLVLAVTRVSQLGLKGLLTAREPAVVWSLGPLGDLGIAASLRVEWLRILGEPGVRESYEVLYVPALIPFVLVAGLTVMLYRLPWPRWRATLAASTRQIARPVVALLGALVLVQLLMLRESTSAGAIPAATDITGQAAAALLGSAWPYAAVWLGALGSFFSGSATISNLTFGAVQARIATEAGLSVPGILALQSAGAALGNMVCIHNIVAVCSILGLRRAEGAILTRAAAPLVLAAAVATAAGAAIMALG
jgi:lactate permease